MTCRFAVLFVCPNPDRDGLRVGVVASRRVGNAVRRSRARRLMRVAARELADRWNDRDVWAVFVARAGATEATSREVTGAIARALECAGLVAAPERRHME